MKCWYIGILVKSGIGVTLVCCIYYKICFSLAATSLGHSVITLEMCQELAGEEDPVGSVD